MKNAGRQNRKAHLGRVVQEHDLGIRVPVAPKRLGDASQKHGALLVPASEGEELISEVELAGDAQHRVERRHAVLGRDVLYDLRSWREQQREQCKIKNQPCTSR